MTVVVTGLVGGVVGSTPPTGIVPDRPGAEADVVAAGGTAVADGLEVGAAGVGVGAVDAGPVGAGTGLGVPVGVDSEAAGAVIETEVSWAVPAPAEPIGGVDPAAVRAEGHATVGAATVADPGTVPVTDSPGAARAPTTTGAGREEHQGLEGG